MPFVGEGSCLIFNRVTTHVVKIQMEKRVKDFVMENISLTGAVYEKKRFGPFCPCYCVLEGCQAST